MTSKLQHTLLRAAALTALLCSVHVGAFAQQQSPAGLPGTAVPVAPVQYRDAGSQIGAGSERLRFLVNAPNVYGKWERASITGAESC